MLKWKCHKLQQQLDEFKNRKTQGLVLNSNANLLLLEANKKYGLLNCSINNNNNRYIDGDNGGGEMMMMDYSQ